MRVDLDSNSGPLKGLFFSLVALRGPFQLLRALTGLEEGLGPQFKGPLVLAGSSERILRNIAWERGELRDLEVYGIFC